MVFVAGVNKGTCVILCMYAYVCTIPAVAAEARLSWSVRTGQRWASHGLGIYILVLCVAALFFP